MRNEWNIGLLCAIVVALLLGSCIPTPPSTPTSTTTPTATTTPTPTTTPTSNEPTLYLDRNYFCRHGPGSFFKDVMDYPAGTVLPIIGTNGSGWWQVGIEDQRTIHTSCWIGGGETLGDISNIPLVTTQISIPVRDFNTVSNGDFVIVGYLLCDHVFSYEWDIKDLGIEPGGFYVSTIPLFEHSFAGWTRDDGISICDFDLP